MTLNEVIVKAFPFVYCSDRFVKTNIGVHSQQENGFQHQIADAILLSLYNTIKVEKRLFWSPFIKQAITKQVKEFCTFNFPPHNSKIYPLLP